MALLKCPDCGKMVSSRVKNCPECGCPAEFFENSENFDNQYNSNDQAQLKTECKEFVFGKCKISYPENSEKFANLYGDYLKLGYDKYNLLRAVFKDLGDADAVVRKFQNQAQKVIDEQINIILQDLYKNGLAMTYEQFMLKYADTYPLKYDVFMEPFLDAYNQILGKQTQLRQDRENSYANRRRWVGGGFGMKGAIKGGIQASVLNAGSSMVSGLGNVVVATLNEGTIEKKKQSLFENEKIMEETCEGIIVCMNGLFYPIQMNYTHWGFWETKST